VGLPNAEELAAILAVARAHGVSRLRVGGLEVQFAPVVVAPVSPGADLVAALNNAAPLPADDDPIETIRDTAGPGANRRVIDPLEILAGGGRLMVDASDPTQAA
jgi:hypothetical protein